MQDQMPTAGTAPQISPPAPHYQGAPGPLPASLSISRPNVRLYPFFTGLMLTVIVSFQPATTPTTTTAAADNALHV
jgi:hypothetical protein